MLVSVPFEPMDKVCKLKWNMRAAKAQISMRGIQVYPPSPMVCFEIQWELKSDEMLHGDDGQFYGTTRYPKKRCLHSRIIHKNACVYRYKRRKRAMVYTISRPII